MLFIDVPYNFESAISVFHFLPLSVSFVILPAFTEIVTNCLLLPLFIFSNLLSFCVFNLCVCDVKSKKLLGKTQRK